MSSNIETLMQSNTRINNSVDFYLLSTMSATTLVMSAALMFTALLADAMTMLVAIPLIVLVDNEAAYTIV